MAIVIRYGGADSTSQILPGIIAGQRSALARKEYELARANAEARQKLLEAESIRQEADLKIRQADESRRQSEFQRAGSAREAYSQALAPQAAQGPENEMQQEMRRTQQIAAIMAKDSPEHAERFLNERQKELSSRAIKTGASKLMDQFGDGLTGGKYVAIGAGGEPIEDPSYSETIKEQLALLQGIDENTDPKQALEIMKGASDTAQAVREKIRKRNEQEAAIGASRQGIAAMMSESAARLKPAQVARLTSLATNIGFDEGDVAPQDADKEAERILRGLVKVNTPFGELEMDPASAIKMQQSMQAIEAQRALAEQRRASAELSKARGLDLPKTKGETGKPNAILDRSRATQVAKTELGDSAKPGDIRKRADEIMRQGVNGSAGARGPAGKILDDMNGGKISREEAIEKLQALGFKDAAAANKAAAEGK